MFRIQISRRAGLQKSKNNVVVSLPLNSMVINIMR
jgi:hypothetical protein